MKSFDRIYEAVFFAGASGMAWARSITSISVDMSTATATISCEAGEVGDGHVVYFAWSTDRVDSVRNMECEDRRRALEAKRGESIPTQRGKNGIIHAVKNTSRTAVALALAKSSMEKTQ